MADDLKTIDQQIDTAINPAALPGQILTLSHNGLLHAIISAVGKLAGYPFTAKASGQAPQGTLLWNDNAMDGLTSFVVTVSKLTADGNDFGTVLGSIVNGDIIKFKDFEGKSALLQYQSHVAATDGFANDTYDITVIGFAENPSFTYTTEENICILDLLGGGGSGATIFWVDKPLIIKSPANSSNGILEIGDYVETFITATRLIKGIYLGGDQTLPASYTILDEINF